jgi:hypothetical protein
MAEAVGVCPWAVRKWVDRYPCEGLAGLGGQASECPHRRPDPHAKDCATVPMRAATSSLFDCLVLRGASATLMCGCCASDRGRIMGRPPLHFALLVSAFACFASSARSQQWCSAANDGAQCVVYWCTVNYGQNYYNWCGKPVTCTGSRGCICTEHVCFSPQCAMNNNSPACCSVRCINYPLIPPPCKGTQCF